MGIKGRVSECLRLDSDLHLRRLWTAGENVYGLNSNVHDDNDMKLRARPLYTALRWRRRQTTQ